MRKHMLGTIAALLAVVLMAGAQTPGSEATRATLEKVTVVRGDGGVSIEMTTKGAVTPESRRFLLPTGWLWTCPTRCWRRPRDVFPWATRA